MSDVSILRVFLQKPSSAAAQKPTVLHTLPYANKGRTGREIKNILCLYQAYLYFSSMVWPHKYLNR